MFSIHYKYITKHRFFYIYLPYRPIQAKNANFNQCFQIRPRRDSYYPLGIPFFFRRNVGRLISKVSLFKPSIFVSSYGTELMFSFVVWFNMCVALNSGRYDGFLFYVII